MSGFNDRRESSGASGGTSYDHLIVQPTSDDEVLATARAVVTEVPDREDALTVLEALGILDRVRELRQGRAA